MPDSLLRFRVPLGFLFALWYVIVARPASGVLFGICLSLVAVGCALRSWAAGFLFKGKRVAVGGPYAYIRNPLYIGSFIIGSGFCLALWRRPLPLSALLLWSAFLAGFGIVYGAKSKAEEKELSRALGPDYDRYASQVPAFIPTRGHVGGLGGQHFSTELYRRNREHQCLIGSFALSIILYLKFHYAV